MQTIWLDAAEFENRGGWMLETQFVREMGQAYLMANHYPGVPVDNASTEFKVEKSGFYRFFVRTKNWKYPEAPGRFTLKVDDYELKNTCGKMPALYWYFEIADDVYLEKGTHTLEVCDKTGWLSRFASVVITDDLDFTPSPELPIMLKQRAQAKNIDTNVTDMGEWDYVVVGGGPGGVGAAISAARNGLKVALINGRPFFGGNAAEEGGVGFDGGAMYHLGYHETGISDEVKRTREHYNISWQKAIEKLLKAEPNITLFENEICIAAECEDDTIKSIECVNTITLKKTCFRSKLFAECTGDGWLGYYAGAKYRIGREAKREFGEEFAPETPDTLTMSGCLSDSRNDVGRFLSFYLKEVDYKVEFNAPDWAVKLPQELYRDPQLKYMTEWWMENSNDFDDLYDSEFARDEFVRLVVGYYDWLINSYEKNHEFENRHMLYLGTRLSKRENRRLIGDYILNQNDFDGKTEFPDSISYSGWKIDVHHPRGIYSGEEGPFLVDQIVPITPIPYRCLYSCNVKNLFVASRCSSFSHVGLGSPRVESTVNTMGQAVGVAAYLCKKYDCTPRDIYTDHIKELQQLLIKQDQTIFGIYNEDPNDLARTATVTATSEDKESGAVAENVINGVHRAKPEVVNAWMSGSNESLPQSITLTLKNPESVGEIHITADTDQAYPRSSTRAFVPFDFTATHLTGECFDGKDWVKVFEIKDNYRRKLIAKFDAVRAEKVRVTVHATTGSNQAKLNEIRIYGN